MFKKRLMKMKKFLDSTINMAVIILMFSLVIVVFSQVFSRYALNHPLIWSEELARYLFIWIVFLSSVVVFRENRHMGVDFFVGMLSPNKQRVVKKITNVIIFSFMILILYVSPQIIKITFRQTSPTLDLPMGVIYLAFPVSLGLMVIEMLFRFLMFLEIYKQVEQI